MWTGFHRFFQIEISLETGNRKIMDLLQPQLMVWLQSVAISLVSVFFLVQSTGPSNTSPSRDWNQLDIVIGSVCSKSGSLYLVSIRFGKFLSLLSSYTTNPLVQYIFMHCIICVNWFCTIYMSVRWNNNAKGDDQLLWVSCSLTLDGLLQTSVINFWL